MARLKQLKYSLKILVIFLATGFHLPIVDCGLKPQNLSILAFMAFSGNDPRDGIVCRESAQVAIDTVNRRDDTLPDFNINAVYRDEGANSLLVVGETIRFLRNYSNIAPIVIGPYFSNGCVRLAPLLHRLDLVGLATGCSATSTAGNRAQYPNLYHTRMTADILIYSRYQFVKQIGAWDRVGILTLASSFRDFSGAVAMQMLLMKNNVKVPWFEASVDIDDAAILSFMASDLRVILLEMTVVDPFIKFLCAAYKWGVTGGSYVFIPQPAAIFDLHAKLPKLPVGCDKAAIAEQMKYTFWVGVTMFSTENLGKTSLGYDKAEFDALLVSKTNVSNSADFIVRDLCHDAMMEALLALNDSQSLLAQNSASLLNYSTNPVEIGRIVNSSVAALNFSGLRVGHLAYRDSKRLEPDEEPQSVYQWSSKTNSFDLVNTVIHEPGRPIDSLDSYKIRATSKKPVWYTLTGNPPKSYPPTIAIIMDSAESYSIAIKAIAGLLIVVQIGLLVLNLCQRFEIQSSRPRIKAAKVMLVLGCVLLDLAAVFFTTGNDQPSRRVYCVLRFTFSVIGLALLNTAIMSVVYLVFAQKDHFQLPASAIFTTTGRLSTFTAHIHFKRQGLPPPPLPDIRRGRTPSMAVFLDVAPNRKLLIIGNISIILFISCNLAVLIAWMVADTPVTNRHEFGIVYDAKNDYYEDRIAFVCASDYISEWLFAICAVEAVMFAGGLAMAFHVRQHLRYDASAMRPYSIAQVNSLTILLGAILLNFILGKEPGSQSIVYSIACLLVSVVSFFIIIAIETMDNVKLRIGNQPICEDLASSHSQRQLAGLDSSK